LSLGKCLKSMELVPCFERAFSLFIIRVSKFQPSKLIYSKAIINKICEINLKNDSSKLDSPPGTTWVGRLFGIRVARDRSLPPTVWRSVTFHLAPRTRLMKEDSLSHGFQIFLPHFVDLKAQITAIHIIF
jgi:hypothetical protein